MIIEWVTKRSTFNDPLQINWLQRLRRMAYKLVYLQSSIADKLVTKNLENDYTFSRSELHSYIGSRMPFVDAFSKMRHDYITREIMCMAFVNNTFHR